jgi:hypothetical protein
MEDRSFQRVRTPVTQMGLAKGLALLPQQRARGKNKFRVSLKSATLNCGCVEHACIGARPAQAGDEPLLDRIGCRC